MRSAEIEDRLRRFFGDTLQCRVRTPSARAWRDLVVVPRYRFGYRPPEPTTPPTVDVSPQLLDEITAWLSDDELDMYLTAIEALLAACLALPGKSPDDVNLLLDGELLDDAPLALRLMSEVELRAIDDGLVAPI